MYSVEHNNVFIASEVTSFVRYHYRQAIGIQNVKRPVTCSA